jgi:hypothetical protein
MSQRTDVYILGIHMMTAHSIRLLHNVYKFSEEDNISFWKKIVQVLSSTVQLRKKTIRRGWIQQSFHLVKSELIYRGTRC